ncbi:MAG: DUF2066 domain-containing protein [Gammaproteobacteria bacterium]|nr:DUF2066 domain-containing protein [Gammaproteobacteria bacterium]MYF38089.1 DUF2066 domain-containing protein [Gammaproteobacteria bacterium]
MHRFCIQFAVLAFLLVGNALRAEPVDWLYDVEVPVNARTQADAEVALQRSVDVLLMRLTGLSTIPRTPEVQTAFANLNTYVKQYEFTRLRANSPLGSGDALVARFNSSLIRELIKEARFPVWPADRPSVVIWLTIHEGTDSKLVQDTTPEALELLNRAQERGIELVIPIMDLQEQAKVKSTSVVGQFWGDIEVASDRYKTEFIAAVSCQKDLFGSYQTSFNYWYQGVEHFDHREFSAREDLPVNIVDHIVDILVSKHAIIREHEEIYRIGVIDVTTVESYAAVLTHLNGLDFIDDFVLVSLDNEVLIFDVYTPSSADLFVELVDATGSLKTTDREDRVIDKKIMQLFTWVPPQ